MNRPTCETCPFWEANFSPKEIEEAGFVKGSMLGDCKRFPPSIRGMIMGVNAEHPKTWESDWCGEHPLLKTGIVAHQDEPGRCPVLVGGERCGKQAGHDGKHVWDRGD